MANGQNAQLAAALGAAYMTGGASLGAGGGAGGGVPSLSGSATAKNKGSGSSNSGGLFGLSSGNAGPSSADAMFGSPFSVFDNSGWNVNFGAAAEISAEVGARSNSSSPSMSAVDDNSENKPGAQSLAAKAFGGVDPMILAGAAVLVLVILRRAK